MFKALVSSAVISSALAAKCLQSPIMTPTCITYGGRERCWYLHVPDGVDPGGAPLVVDFHAFNSCAENNQFYTGWKEIAEKEKLLLVWPQGTEDLAPAPYDSPSWNAGQCCGSAGEVPLQFPEGPAFNIDDEGFIVAMVEHIAGTNAVDSTRVYMAGHSNGCNMAQRMAERRSSLVAAVGCHAAYLVTAPQVDLPTFRRYNYTSPVPVIEVHGTDDLVVSYSDFFGISAVKNLGRWAQLNQCQNAPVTTASADGYVTTAVSGCDNDAEVRLLTLPRVGHSPYKLFDSCRLVCPQAMPCFEDSGCNFRTGTGRNSTWSAPFDACNQFGDTCDFCYSNSKCGAPFNSSTQDTNIDTTQIVWDFMKNFRSAEPSAEPTPEPTAEPTFFDANSATASPASLALAGSLALLAAL